MRIERIERIEKEQVVVREVGQTRHGHRMFAAGEETYITFAGCCMTIEMLVAEFAVLYIRSPW